MKDLTVAGISAVVLASGCATSGMPATPDAAPSVAPPAAAAAPVPAPARSARDLTGVWGYNNRGVQATAQGASTPFYARDANLVNFETDFAVLERSEENLPLYKPEYWELIRQKDYHGLGDDPVFTCKPAGVPRMGPPQKIVQDGDMLVFLYAGAADTWRMIPTDGRKLTDEQLGDATWKGYASGRWDGDTLVIESKAFNDQSWLGWAGWVHSMDMVVTEKLWRVGDTLHWQATVDDTMLISPWTTHEEMRQLNPDRMTWFWESPPCIEYDLEHIVDKDVRG